MTFIFVSSPKARALQLLRKDGTVLAEFEKNADFGLFSTEKEDIAEELRNYPSFGRDFKEWKGSGKPRFSEKEVHHGVVTSTVELNAEQIEIEKQKVKFEFQEELKAKLVRFGELKNYLLKKDGSYRADATEEQINEYELLKEEIGV